MENALMIEKIFTDMMDLPVNKIVFDNSEEFCRKTDNVRLKSRPYISYGDVLFLLYYLPDSSAYEHLDRGEREEIRNALLCELFMAMRDSMDKCDAVRNFMLLKVDEFLFHISSGSTERSEERIRADIEYYREKTLCCSEYRLSESSTLSDLADEILRITDKESKSEEEYRKAVHICNEDLYYFLIKYVRKKYYRVFDVSIQCE